MLAILDTAAVPVILLALLVLLLFGARKIAGLGKSMEELKKAQDAFSEHLKRALENQYWDQYDAQKTDVTERWMRNRPEHEKKSLWKPRSLNPKRGRVVITPCV